VLSRSRDVALGACLISQGAVISVKPTPSLSSRNVTKAQASSLFDGQILQLQVSMITNQFVNVSLFGFLTAFPVAALFPWVAVRRHFHLLSILTPSMGDLADGIVHVQFFSKPLPSFRPRFTSLVAHLHQILAGLDSAW
jgi:hypothetical protein